MPRGFPETTVAKPRLNFLAAQLGEQRLRVPGNELVQHGSFRRAASVPAERLSGRAGRPFVQAACEHMPVL